MIKFTAPEDRIVGSPTSKVGEKVGETISEVELQILSLLREDPAYTYAAIAEKAQLNKYVILQCLPLVFSHVAALIEITAVFPGEVCRIVNNDRALRLKKVVQ